MRKLFAILLACLLAAGGLECEARKFSVSTNLLGYAALGTMNIEGSYSLSRYVSLTVGARYNPFTFRASVPESQFQLRQQSYCIGARVWPWHTGSGWWFAGKGRYQEYNMGGIVSVVTSEGDRFGVGLSAGYTYMLSPHLNIEFGLGFWGGIDFFRDYSCQVCGLTVDEGRKAFMLPDDVLIALVYVF